jgi:predicted transcriptional regulator
MEMPKYLYRTKVSIKAQTLKKLIERMNLTLGEFAKRCQITSSTLSLFLSHRREATPIIRRRIINQLKKMYPKIEWEDVFYFEENEHDSEEE